MPLSSLRRTPRLMIVICVCVTGFCTAQDSISPESDAEQITPKITIGKETTWITEPLNKYGSVDYFAAIHQRFSQGVTPANNAVVVLYQAMGPAPDGMSQSFKFFELLGIARVPEDGKYFEDLIEWSNRTGHKKPGETDADVLSRRDLTNSKPWTESDFPEIGLWLKDNAVPLGRVTDATARTEYYSPFSLLNSVERRLVNVLLPGVHGCQSLARALLSRAMLHLGSNDRISACSDLMTAHKLGRLVGRGPTIIEGLVGIAIEHRAIEAELRMLSMASGDAKFIAHYRAQIEQLPSISPMADKFDVYERLTYLDSCQQMARGNMRWKELASDLPIQAWDDVFRKMIASNVDWNEVLRLGNRWYSRVADAARLPTFSEQRIEIRRLYTELAPMRRPPTGLDLIPFMADKAWATRWTAHLMISMLMESLHSWYPAECRRAQRMLNLKLALALAQWRCEHDSYPETLAELAPKYLAVVPTDLFNDQPLHYERTADGYRFYSVGENLQDDMGLTFGDDPAGDDLIVKMPVR